MSKLAMPEPPGLSCPDQLTVKLGELRAGSAATLLVGGMVAPTKSRLFAANCVVKAVTPSEVGRLVVVKLPLSEPKLRESKTWPARGLKPPLSVTVRVPLSEA